MASPFNFRVLLISNGYRKYLTFKKHDTEINEYNISQLPTFKEDLSLDLDFHVSDKSRPWKLYVLGIDGYYGQINGVKKNPDYQAPDKQKANGSSCRYYLLTGFHNIYSPGNGNASYGFEDKSLIPNVYTIKVTDGVDWYYSHFAVRPKELTYSEWYGMLEEIGNVSEQLAVSHADWQQGFISQKEHISEKFANELTRMANRLRISLHFILNDARYDVGKRYRWVNQGQEREIDSRSIRMMCMRPTNTGKVYAPFRYMNYDTGDNQWIKFITTRLMKATGRSIECYAEILTLTRSTKKHMSVTVNQQKLLRLRNYFNYVLNTSFLSKVKSRPPMFVPKGLIYSPRYNQYYQMYLHLKNLYQKRLVIEPNQYQYRNTDKLYEFWVFIKTVSALTAQGYHPVKGWSCGSSSDKWLLKPNTRVLLKKPDTDVSLRVVYDDDLSKPSLVSDNPLAFFGTPHKRPDLRIDVLHNGTDYWGSLILDAKYKDLDHVVHDSYNNSQLSDYALKSFDRDDNSVFVAPGLRCSIGAIAVYTGPNGRNLIQKYHVELSRLRQLGVNLEMLRPGTKTSLFSFANDVHILLSKRVKAMKQRLADHRKLEALR